MGLDQANSAKVLDVEGTLARFGGDEGLFREMASILLDDAPPIARDLKAAVLAGDSTAIQMKAHALKGLVIGCGGLRTSQAAQKLEDAGRKQELNDLAQLMTDVDIELRSLMEAIRPYSQSPTLGGAGLNI